MHFTFLLFRFLLVGSEYLRVWDPGEDRLPSLILYLVQSVYLLLYFQFSFILVICESYKYVVCHLKGGWVSLTAMDAHYWYPVQHCNKV